VEKCQVLKRNCVKAAKQGRAARGRGGSRPGRLVKGRADTPSQILSENPPPGRILAGSKTPGAGDGQRPGTRTEGSLTGGGAPSSSRPPWAKWPD